MPITRSGRSASRGRPRSRQAISSRRRGRAGGQPLISASMPLGTDASQRNTIMWHAKRARIKGYSYKKKKDLCRELNIQCCGGKYKYAPKTWKKQCRRRPASRC